MSPASRTGALVALTLICLGQAATAEAQGFFRRRGSASVLPIYRVVETSMNPANATAPTPMLGSFYPTPYIVVQGTGPTGSGYAPLGQYGLNNLDTYGPSSAFRSISAPVRVYSRGYDGAVYESEGTSTSTPFNPQASPVVYPTPYSSYYRPRGRTILPSGDAARAWVDQN